ncbi:Uncharacterised protein [uncultured archaeon]|nr:Uncharacterised protein [uncultured archaeon]
MLMLKACMIRGTALKDDESHTLSVRVQKLIRIDSMGFKRLLMNSKRTLEELREAIKEQIEEITYSGDLKLDDVSYKLVNINVLRLQHHLILDANVADSQFIHADKTMPIVGHLSFAVSEDEFAEANTGELTMKGRGYTGTYQVLLDIPTNPDAPVQSS